MGENSWVFDSLVGFLRGPVWNVPILTFIEHKSLIFEPGCEDNDDHKKIHEEYKNLVDFMLGSYMEDIGITPEQFESACGKAAIKTTFHQTLFEQVWAADDYEIFKRMMIQKNLELQLQALELLQQRYGVIPESCTPGDAMTPEEAQVMEQVIKKSLEEHEAIQSGLSDEAKQLEEALSQSMTEKDKLEQDRAHEKELLEKALKLSINDEPSDSGETEEAKPQPKSTDNEEEPEETEETEANNEEEDEQETDQEQGEVENEEKEEPEEPEKTEVILERANVIDPHELKRRQEYLKAQRDKLLALKQQEREKQLAAYEESAPQKRPKSSRAARRVLHGQSIDAQTLQVRKALAERLKAEVIGDQ